MKYILQATCLFGLEGILGKEIDDLGYKRIETIDGRVTFEGDELAIARCNMWLRTAERLFIKVGDFNATTFEELFEGTKALEWSLYIGPDDQFPVKGHSVRSKLFAISSCQSIVKKAIVDKLSYDYDMATFPETEAKIQIEFFILNDRVQLLIDTSGTPLFKRGYRTEAGTAPLRETLAASLVLLSRPREEVTLIDPFCGSGTIPIEAALIMTNTAPGLNRSFAAQSFDFLPTDIWQKAKDEAKKKQTLNTTFKAKGSDIDSSVIEIAKANAKRAGMSQFISFEVADATKIKKGDYRATIVCNPPYGERMLEKKEAHALYKKIGSTFKELAPWQIYIITSEERFESIYGKKADKVRKLYNGMIKCNYYQYFKNSK